MNRILSAALLALLPLFGVAAATAQTNVTLGGFSADPSAPLEIEAESLSVDQTARSAVFEGNVVIVQGDARIAAGRVSVVYGEDGSSIERLNITGGVTFVTASEAAEAQSADYDLISGQLVLTGDVLLTQGGSAISAQSMTVNLNDGTARMEGGVRTVLGN